MVAIQAQKSTIIFCLREWRHYQQNQQVISSLFRYEIDGKNRSINAVNYFREGINPTWEDENNKFGGRLIFQIDKEIENFQEVY